PAATPDAATAAIADAAAIPAARRIGSVRRHGVSATAAAKATGTASPGRKNVIPPTALPASSARPIPGCSANRSTATNAVKARGSAGVLVHGPSQDFSAESVRPLAAASSGTPYRLAERLCGNNRR